MRGRTACLCIALVGVAVACSVVDDGKVEQIEPQFGLDTLPSSTVGETTTTQQVTTTIALETTTPATPNTEPVTLYFEANGELTPVEQPLTTPVTLGKIILALQSGPPSGDAGSGLRTVLPDIPGLVRATTDGSGVATVTLPEDFFDLIPQPDQRLVIAQLVLTLTSSRGIGQVVFTVAVPSASGQVRPAGQHLSFSDYRPLTDSNSQIEPDPTVPETATTLGG